MPIIMADLWAEIRDIASMKRSAERWTTLD